MLSTQRCGKMGQVCVPRPLAPPELRARTAAMASAPLFRTLAVANPRTLTGAPGGAKGGAHRLPRHGAGRAFAAYGCAQVAAGHFANAIGHGAQVSTAVPIDAAGPLPTSTEMESSGFGPSRLRPPQQGPSGLLRFFCRPVSVRQAGMPLSLPDHG